MHNRNRTTTNPPKRKRKQRTRRADPPQLSIRLEQAGSSAHEGAPSASQVGHLQEGNDIYLACQLDANPRPAKPILWRFNGRPLQAQGSSTIVMNNQSLVLRGVSRNQSGSYTCDATNSHGSNTSRPLELLVRHAPVCAADDM